MSSAVGGSTEIEKVPPWELWVVEQPPFSHPPSRGDETMTTSTSGEFGAKALSTVPDAVEPPDEPWAEPGPAPVSDGCALSGPLTPRPVSFRLEFPAVGSIVRFAHESWPAVGG